MHVSRMDWTGSLDFPSVLCYLQWIEHLNNLRFVFLLCCYVRQNLRPQEAPAALWRGRLPKRDQPTLSQQEHQRAAGQDPAQSERGPLRPPTRVQAGKLCAQGWRGTREGEGRKKIWVWGTHTPPTRSQSEVGRIWFIIEMKWCFFYREFGPEWQQVSLWGELRNLSLGLLLLLPAPSH